MAGIFSDLTNGIRKPDVVMNMGPLPSEGGLPNGFNATTDARINYGSALLGDLNPYEYGEPGRIADQMSYVNVPHRIQKIVPELRLPEARDGNQTFLLSHAVDDGDVAFSLRVRRNAGTIDRLNTFERMELSHVVDPFVNLATVNYLLAGLQRNWAKPEAIKWQQFIVDTDFMPSLTQARSGFTVRHALRFIQEIARPFGVTHGSEKQGGQHEGSSSAVTFPVNFITTLVVGGKVDNLVNMWRESDISAGDDLIFHLAWLPICKQDNSMDYVLNHWRKGTIRQRFEYEEGGVNFGWQLVPAIYGTYPPMEVREGYDWRQHGYWHVARTQIMKAREITQILQQQTKVQGCYFDDSRFLRGSLLDVTFEPVFNRMGFVPRPPRALLPAGQGVAGVNAAPVVVVVAGGGGGGGGAAGAPPRGGGGGGGNAVLPGVHAPLGPAFGAGMHPHEDDGDHHHHPHLDPAATAAAVANAALMPPPRPRPRVRRPPLVAASAPPADV
jgi:hypothetical protein